MALGMFKIGNVQHSYSPIWSSHATQTVISALMVAWVPVIPIEKILFLIHVRGKINCFQL